MLYFKDFISGAMIRNIVDRAKKTAIKRLIDEGDKGKGLRLEDIKTAIQEEYKENEDLPNTTNPDDWAKISGRKGERIVNIRAMTNEPERKKKEVKAEKKPLAMQTMQTLEQSLFMKVHKVQMQNQFDLQEA